MFKLAESECHVVGPPPDRAGLIERMREIREAVEQVGAGSVGDPGSGKAETEKRRTEQGWRTVLATAPVDSYRFQVYYGAELIRAHPAGPSEERAAADPPSAREEWETPEQLARLVTGFLSGQPPQAEHEEEAEWVAGCLGVLALTLLTLKDAEERRDLDIATRTTVKRTRALFAASANRMNVAAELLRFSSVREAIRDIYRPLAPDEFLATAEDDQAAVPFNRYDPEFAKYDQNRNVWSAFPFSQLRFLEFGTTSVVLEAPVVGSDPRAQNGTGLQVLKCVLLPYASTPAVAEATLKYHETYGNLVVKDADSKDVQCREVVRVEASSSNWIVMDKAEGRTLHDLLSALVETKADGTSEVNGRAPYRLLPHGLRRSWELPRLRLVSEVMPVLLDALRSLYAARAADPPKSAESNSVLTGAGTRPETPVAPLCHADLNPRNVMVLEKPPVNGLRVFQVTLIDLGRNHLLGRGPTARQRTDGIYIAPEVPQGHKPDALADLYAIGQIIIGLCGVGRGQDGTVPDTLYSVTPTLARLLEDLIDPVPERRLRLFAAVRRQPGDSKPTSFSLDRLKQTLEQELKALEEAESRSGLLREVGPLHAAYLILAPLSASPGRLGRLLKARNNQKEASIQRNDEYVRWLAVWSWANAVSWGLCLLSLALLTLSDAAVPIPWPTVIANAQHSAGLADRLAARLTGFTFALCAVKYYQGIYAGLTVRWAQSRSRSAWWAELWVRSNALLVGLLVIPVNLLMPHAWTVASALGLTSAFFVNRSGYAYARSVVVSSDGALIAQDPGRIPGLAMYRDWGPSMLVYVVVVWVFAVLINLHVLRDVPAYASVVSAINLALFYLLKCAIDAIPVRAALTRCYLAAERLHLGHPGDEKTHV
ncbi:hypothetical protein OG900_31965 [Streptomyces sp. NBC_00433]